MLKNYTINLEKNNYLYRRYCLAVSGCEEIKNYYNYFEII